MVVQVWEWEVWWTRQAGRLGTHGRSDRAGLRGRGLRLDRFDKARLLRDGIESGNRGLQGDRRKDHFNVKGVLAGTRNQQRDGRKHNDPGGSAVERTEGLSTSSCKRESDTVLHHGRDLLLCPRHRAQPLGGSPHPTGRVGLSQNIYLGSGAARWEHAELRSTGPQHREPVQTRPDGLALPACGPAS